MNLLSSSWPTASPKSFLGARPPAWSFLGARPPAWSFLGARPPAWSFLGGNRPASPSAWCSWPAMRPCDRGWPARDLSAAQNTRGNAPWTRRSRFMTRYRSRLAAGDTSAAWMVLLVIGVALLAARVVLAMRYGGGDFQPVWAACRAV